MINCHVTYHGDSCNDEDYDDYNDVVDQSQSYMTSHIVMKTIFLYDDDDVIVDYDEDYDNDDGDDDVVDYDEDYDNDDDDDGVVDYDDYTRDKDFYNNDNFDNFDG